MFTLFKPLGAHAEVSYRGGFLRGQKLSSCLRRENLFWIVLHICCLPFGKSFFLRIRRVEEMSNFSTSFQKFSKFFRKFWTQIGCSFYFFLNLTRNSILFLKMIDWPKLWIGSLLFVHGGATVLVPPSPPPSMRTMIQAITLR